MFDVSGYVQTTLGNALAAAQVHVFEGRRSPLRQGDPNPDEYVIFDVSADPVEVSADGGTMARTAEIDVKYYMAEQMSATNDGRALRKERVTAILEAMIEAGFTCPGGMQYIGDVDLISFDVWLLSFEYTRLERY